MKTPTAEQPAAELPRYETAQSYASRFDLELLDSTAFSNLPAGIDLYLVFLEPGGP